MALSFTAPQWAAAFAGIAGYDPSTSPDYSTAAVGKVYRAGRTIPATDTAPATTVLAVDVVPAAWLGTSEAQALAASLVTSSTAALSSLVGFTVTPVAKATRLATKSGDFWKVTLTVFEEGEIRRIDGGTA